jgi:small subunit ribosomal protein S21
VRVSVAGTGESSKGSTGSPNSGDRSPNGMRDSGGRDSGFVKREGFNKDFRREDRPKLAAMEVAVDHNIEKAIKVLKRKLIREGLFKELKARRYYEKPSERKKRKHKESVKKSRKEEARQRRSSQLI